LPCTPASNVTMAGTDLSRTERRDDVTSSPRSSPALVARFTALIEPAASPTPPRDGPTTPKSLPLRDLRAAHEREIVGASVFAGIPVATARTQTTMVTAPPPTPASVETLLQSLCANLYVGQDAAGSRMMLALDATLPATAVELIREGAYLRVRLHARDDRSMRLLCSSEDALTRELSASSQLGVHVEIVRGTGNFS
ncbi:MAG TPA: type III secretion HpaP family protein, partial [Povalibacter sp.]